MVPVFNRQENFKCFRYNDIPHPRRLPIGSLALFDSGAKGDLRMVQIGVRVGARDSFQKQATRSNPNILEPLGQIPKTTRSNIYCNILLLLHTLLAAKV